MFCVAVFCFSFFFQINIFLNKLVQPFWLPVSISHLISVPPTGRDMRRKKWEVSSLVTLLLLMIGSSGKFVSPRFPWSRFQPCTNRPRNLPRARIKTSQRPPQNTRDKGNLIFYSYSKTDVRAPGAVLSTSDSTMAISSKYTQELSVQIVFFTFSFNWFLCFYVWAVIWAILLTCSLVCMSLR